MSKYSAAAGEIVGLFDLSMLKERSRAKSGHDWPIITIQEAGLDGFWNHRLLEETGIESQVVDATSIAMPRRYRRVKTDRIDGETLLRVLLAYKRGEPRVCSMVRASSRQEEDQRRLGRERKVLTNERDALLAAQWAGIGPCR